MIGGSIPGETRVASIAIFEHTETLDYGAAGLLSLLLMIISYAALLFIGKQGVAPHRSHRTAQLNANPIKTHKEIPCSQS